MKNLSLLFALLFSVVVTAQNFPGDNPQLLLNREVKVLEKEESSQEFGYVGFYKDKDLRKVYAKGEYNSKYEDLVNKIFTVKEVTNPIGGASRLTLVSGKETLYFRYDLKYEFKYPFEVIGGLDLPDDFYCKKINKTPSKQDPSKHFYVTNRDEGILYFKMESNGVIVYIVDFNIPSKESSDVTEASIELENGEVINASNPNVKKENSEYGGFIYNAGVTLGKNDIELLKQYKIVGISINGIKLKIKQGDTHKGVFNCLITKE